MRLLFFGDIIGRPGRKILKEHLPYLKERYKPSLIAANGENAAGGIGLTEKVGKELLLKVHVLTSGNHIWDKKEVLDYLDREPKLIRPANYPSPSPGRGSCIVEDLNGYKVAFLNLQGRVFMEPIDCPFRKADQEIDVIQKTTSTVIVDFHAEATSEKQALGWYLDGKVSAVLGTHTHVPTADEKILPQGTAYITDIGMVGGYHSVIGIKREQAVDRFLTSRPQRFGPSKEGYILNAVCIEIDPQTGKSLGIERIKMGGDREK
ncbi:MAG: TIGR00282 family metallophosphoesterase [Candidatus Aminicenantes bacterium]|nr:TIGR00282 family metallophosphoesterase [Candidatus Aminicenantes bacterium]